MTPRPRTTRVSQSDAPAPPIYPFAAIVGQEEMKLALVLNVITPSLGGILLMGHRGTAKSTAVRSLAALLPPLTTVRECVYHCDPEEREHLCAECRARLASDGRLPRGKAAAMRIVELPLGATEDRVCGSINFERALSEGIKKFEPGLLAQANRGFLYVDEVNLLEDHLVDLLLDVAATGRNIVEREGISAEHPARFVLVGSGNPEEGELRPQLLDRFGLYCEVRTADDLEERIEIIERREAFDLDPAGFAREWEGEQSRLRLRLRRAQKHLRSVGMSREVLRFVAKLCARLGVDGHRGEITITRAARALASFEGADAATTDHVRRVAAMALRHRLRRDPLEQTPGGARVERALEELTDEAGGDVTDRAQPPSQETSRGGSSSKRSEEQSGGTKQKTRDGENPVKQQGVDPAGGPDKEDRRQKLIPPAQARLPETVSDAGTSSRRKTPPADHSFSARRGGANSTGAATHGRYARAVTHKPAHARIALDATFRAAAPFQLTRRRETTSLHVKVNSDDLRYKQLRRKCGTLFIFAVDASGSMAANRIAQAKDALAQLLRRAYVNRDRVALVSFRGSGATLLLPPSNSTARARSMLNNLPVGGATPLAAGLMRALEVARRAVREGAERIHLLVFTDGRANVPLYDGGGAGDQTLLKQRVAAELARVGDEVRRSGMQTTIIDTQRRWVSGGEGQTLAGAVGGRYVPLPPGASSAHFPDLSGSL